MSNDATGPAVHSELSGAARASLRVLVDGPHGDVRRQVRGWLTAEEFTATPDGPGPAASRDAYRDEVFARLLLLADRGVGYRSLPAEYGGNNDPAGRVVGFEALAEGDLSLLVKVGVQFGLFGGAVHRLGTERHHAEYLPRIASAELPGCFAMSESGHGSDVRAIRTTATYDAGSGTIEVDTPDIRARKDWIGNAARHGRIAVVFAQLTTGGVERGVHAILVPLRDESGALMPGIEIEDCGEKMGLNGVDNGRILFHHVRVPRANLLDRYGQIAPDGTYSSPIESDGRRFFTMIGALVEGRICIAAASQAVARSALTIAVRYGARRRQFAGEPDGPETPLLDYLTHQRRLLPRVAASYSLAAAQEQLVRRYAALAVRDTSVPDTPETETEQRAVEALAAGIKAASSRLATDTLVDCRESCGGQGYLAENQFGRLKADSDVFTTFEGDNTVLLQLVAKSLLSEYAEQFEDMDVVGFIRRLAGRTAARIAESNPLAGLGTGARLSDLDSLLALLRGREEHLLETLAERFRHLLSDGTDPLTALTTCQDHAVSTARAHIDRVVVEAAAARVASCGDAELAPVLSDVARLHAASILADDRGWLQEHGAVNREQSKELVALVNHLCRRLRPVAVALVDGWGIPDALLRAPIGLASVAALPTPLQSSPDSGGSVSVGATL